MEKYQSKEQTVRRTADDVFQRFTDLSALTPMLGDKVDGWQADGDSCSFRVQGFPISLHVDERIPGELIRVVSDGTTPVKFAGTIHLSKKAPYETGLTVALEIELNMMLRMMIGSKIQDGLNAIAENTALYLNQGV